MRENLTVTRTLEDWRLDFPDCAFTLPSRNEAIAIGELAARAVKAAGGQAFLFAQNERGELEPVRLN